MKKLGLVGGMGPDSTIPYYHGITHGVQQALGRPFFPNLTIESVDLFHVVDLLKAESYDELVDFLTSAIENLAKAGCEFVAMASNTPHIVFDTLQARSPLPIVSIVEATCAAAVKAGYKKVGLLGTIFTMDNDFFKLPFERNGIEIVVPNEAEKEFINDKIYNELEYGINSAVTRARFVEIIQRLHREKGIDAIILGCTELPLIISGTHLPIPTLDTTEIHINKLVEEMVNQ